MTYLFRGTQGERISVVGIKEETKNSLDVIYIGGSAAYRYWEPLKAYKEYGFTSYDLATSSIQAESILPYIKYAQQYQNPDLYIIGVRSFQYYENTGNEVGLRNSSDALDIGNNRFQLINTYLNNRDIETDEVALYWDLAKYHTNYEALKNRDSWALRDNSAKCESKGFKALTAWSYLDKPEGFQNEIRAELPANDRNTLVKLLEYLKNNNLKALFVVCPYYITQEDYSKYNTMNDIIASYGYDFLNTNDYYEEMAIDFSKDFYDISHVNSLGAEKYTTFLGNYLLNHYSLPNHKGSEEFGEWESLAEEFIDEDADSKETILKFISYAEEGEEIADIARTTDDFLKWASLLRDERYTMIAVGNEHDTEQLLPDYKKMLESINLADLFGRENYIKIIKNGNVIDSNDDGRTIISADIGQEWSKVPCVIENIDGKNEVYINGKNYNYKREDAINILVFDNYYRTISDSVYLRFNEGKIKIVR